MLAPHAVLFWGDGVEVDDYVLTLADLSPWAHSRKGPISVLSDARGLPRQFLDGTESSDQLDVGAYELVAKLSMSCVVLVQRLPDGLVGWIDCR